MLKFLKFVLIPVVMLGCVSYGIFFYDKTAGSTADKGIAFVLDHMNHQGKLNDIKEEISVDSVDDIKLFVEEDKVTIDYGKIRLKWRMEDFLLKENIDNLEKIGITVRENKETGELVVMYRGEKVERWVV